MNGTLTIGRVAKAAGVTIDTIRFYERRGLVRPASRRVSGYRVYHEDGIRRLRFIRRAQELGFALKEIAGLLRLRAGGGVSCVRVRDRASRHLAEVTKKLDQLNRIRAVLEGLIATCAREGATAACPILDSLERETAANQDDDNKGERHE